MSPSPTFALSTSSHETTLGTSNATDIAVSKDGSVAADPIYYPDPNLQDCVELSGCMHFFVVEDSYCFTMKINGEQHCDMKKEGVFKSTGSWFDVDCDEGYSYRTKGTARRHMQRGLDMSGPSVKAGMSSTRSSVV